MAGRGQPWAEQGDDAQEQGLVLVQAEEGGAGGGGEGLAAGEAAEARSLWEWTLTLPLSLTPLSAQAGLAAEYAPGVHGSIPPGAMAVASRQILPWTPFRLPPDRLSRFPGVLPIRAASGKNSACRFAVGGHETT